MTIEDGLRTLITEIVRAEIRAALAPPSDEYMTPAQAAAVAQVTPATVRRWLRSGRLTARHAGSRLLVARADLDRMLRSAGTSDPKTDAAVLARLGRGLL